MKVRGGVKGVEPLATSWPLRRRLRLAGEPGLGALMLVSTSMLALPAGTFSVERKLTRATARALYS
ncbi:hypothetical protein D3C86_2187120 [compost metagenome]